MIMQARGMAHYPHHHHIKHIRSIEDMMFYTK
jgi:hypothetical protein